MWYIRFKSGDARRPASQEIGLFIFMPSKNKPEKKKIAAQEVVRFMSLAVVKDADLEETAFEVLRTGEFHDNRYGKFEITEEKLLALKKNFEENVLEVEVALDVNHEPENGAFAWLKSLEVRDVGDGKKGLFARFKDFTEDGKKFFREKIYKYFSVEFGPFSKVEDGKKVSIKDVLRGIALTNRPVIKGMQPTFLSEISNYSSHDMTIIKTLADELLKRDSVSKDDVAMLKKAYELAEGDMPAEEQVEAQAAVEQVEAKAEASAEAEAKDAEAKAKAEADAAEAAKAEAEKANNPEALQAAEKTLVEVNAKLAEANATVAKLQEEKQARTLAERADALILSEKSEGKGFSAVNKDAVTAFVKTLSDEQYTQFAELLPKYAMANLAELGATGAGILPDAKVKVGETTFAVQGADVDAEIKALAAKEKLSYFDASIKYAESKK